jgi:hypothetical protein
MRRVFRILRVSGITKGWLTPSGTANVTAADGAQVASATAPAQSRCRCDQERPQRIFLHRLENRLLPAAKRFGGFFVSVLGV